jgi:hypothetical protein
MNPVLKSLLDHMERFNDINKSDIPVLIKLVRELETETRLAWLQLETLESRVDEVELAYKLINAEEL